MAPLFTPLIGSPRHCLRLVVSQVTRGHAEVVAGILYTGTPPLLNTLPNDTDAPGVLLNVLPNVTWYTKKEDTWLRGTIYDTSTTIIG